MLGVIQSKLGNGSEAVQLLEQAFELAPGNADFAHNLALAKAKHGDPDGAVKAFGHALVLKPSSVATCLELALVLHELGRHGEALATLERGLVLAPHDTRLHGTLGALLLLDGDVTGAEKRLRKALACDPRNVKALINLGVAVQRQQRHVEARDWLERAIALDPHDTDAMHNLSRTLAWMGEFASAEQLLVRAIGQRPEDAELLNGLGGLRYQMGRPDSALAPLQAALRLRPNLYEAAHNLALSLLTLGDFVRGFELYELRWHTRGFANTNRSAHKPLWKGEEFRGKRLLLHAEQGIGDSIQMLRYLPMVAARGGPVLLEIQEPLVRLLHGNPAVTAIWSRHDVPACDFDVQIPLFSLPRVFGTTLDRLPADVPYLQAPAECVAQVAGLLRTTDRPRVALVWAGSPENHNDRNRSIDLSVLEPLLTVPDIDFVSLQHGKAARQIAERNLQERVVDLSDAQMDLLDTAALLHNVDLLISVDTAALHLAGALARPAWGLIAHAQDFRWLLEREDSPWYPTLRLFRQSRHGEWQPVIERVRAELARWRLTAAKPHAR